MFECQKRDLRLTNAFLTYASFPLTFDRRCVNSDADGVLR